MAKDLNAYYLKNYSQCNLQYSFLASWQGLAYPSHVIQSISLPFLVLTVYIILKKTPSNMKSFSIPLLHCHIWYSLLNLLASTLATPYIYIRFFAGFGVGVLSWLGVPFMYQTLLGLLSLSGSTSSCIFLFENRSHSLRENTLKIKGKYSRIIYHFLMFMINCSILVVVFGSPSDQEVYKLQLLELDPCPTPEFFESDLFIISADKNLMRFCAWVLGPFLIFNSTGHVLLVVYSMDCGCQELINLSTLTIQLHGIAGSLTILTVYSCYRRAVIRIFHECKRESERNSESNIGRTMNVLQDWIIKRQVWSDKLKTYEVDLKRGISENDNEMKANLVRDTQLQLDCLTFFEVKELWMKEGRSLVEIWNWWKNTQETADPSYKEGPM
ncbi:hypothetical protein CRE_09026 [Caenorhabditis remanei]|uniref:Uncharacterized protein n=1 Tax=Caenorhabditis remanei TaxID=31234 RepID=E3LIV3_CAERE|nr:hypothetical protein CRE_09026 [Caenorhabditis remanei]